MTKNRANLTLLLVTCIWGFAFAAQRIGSAHMSALSFNAARFLLGGSLVALLAGWRLRDDSKLGSKTWLTLDGCALGGALALAALLQQIGVPLTTTANAGFLTIMNVVFVPALASMIGHTPRKIEILGALMAVVGAYFMSVSGDFSIHTGDWWVLAGALFWAIHILLVSAVSQRHDPIKLAAEQFIVCGALSALGAWLFEHSPTNGLGAALPAILFAGLVSVAIAYTLQVVAQRYVTPSHAVIILSLEGVFGALAGWLLFKESMSLRAIIGASILTAGVAVAQLYPPNTSPNERT